jgi:hypothetical protein
MDLESLRGWMKGQDVVVVGCGPSADPGVYNTQADAEQAWCFPLAADYDEHWTIACNRAVTFSSPDFAVCIEPFINPIWPIMREANPPLVFSHICKDRRGKQPFPRIVQMPGKDVREWLTPEEYRCGESVKRMRSEGVMDWQHDLTLPAEPLKLGQSPFYAAAFAILMGFETVGLIGVDLTEDRYPDVRGPNRVYGRLAKIAETLGSRLVNLSPDSRLESIPQGTWQEIRTK